jgi:hypothetical protein
MTIHIKSAGAMMGSGTSITDETGREIMECSRVTLTMSIHEVNRALIEIPLPTVDCVAEETVVYRDIAGRQFLLLDGQLKTFVTSGAMNALYNLFPRLQAGCQINDPLRANLILERVKEAARLFRAASGEWETLS